MVLHVAITVPPPAPLTALELLEEFADTDPSWTYLEDTSTTYWELTGRASAVLQYRGWDRFGRPQGRSADVVFSLPERIADPASPVYLRTVLGHGPACELTFDERERVLADLLHDLSVFIGQLPFSVAVDVETAKAPASA